MNLNDLAVKVTKAEGLKKSVNIGQVKEIMKILFTELGKTSLADVAKILNKYQKK